MKNAYAKEQAELRRQLLNYGALVGQQFNVDIRCPAWAKNSKRNR